MTTYRHARTAVFLVLALLLVSCGGQPAAAPSPTGSVAATPLQIHKAVIAWASADAVYGPLWYAQDNGIFKKYGIESELIYLESGTKGVQGLVAGQADILMADGVSVVNANLSGAQVRIIGLILGTLTGNAYVSKDIQSTDQLKGKKWGISTFGSESHLASQLAITSFGLDPTKDVTVVQIGSQGSRFAALQAGQVQGTSLLPPVSNQAEAMGFKKVAELPKLAPDYFSGGVGVMAATLQQRPAMVKAFLKAFAEATAAYKKDRAGGVQLLRKYLNIDEANAKNAEAAWDYYTPLLSSTLRPSEKSIQFHLDRLGETDPRAKTFKVSDIPDLKLLTELENEGFFKTLP